MAEIESPAFTGLSVAGHISRILSRVTIHLCGYPAPRRAVLAEPVRLAPDGVWRAGRVAAAAGGLLPHRFTLTGDVSGESVAGGLFSVPLSVGFRRLPVGSVLPFGVRTFLEPLRARGHPACVPNATWTTTLSIFPCR